MKKQIVYVIAIAFLTLGLVSCEKESAGKTGKVDYVVLKLLGESQIKLSLGDTYVEPGWTATDKGKDVHDKVSVTIVDMMDKPVSAVTTDMPGIFTITYSAISQDGMYISDQRLVLVFDPTLTASIEGTFDVDFEKSARLNDGKDWNWTKWYQNYSDPSSATADYAQDHAEVTFKQVVPGIYNASDLLGGFYGQVRGLGIMYGVQYGASYKTYFDMTGMVVLNADMSLKLISSHINGWDDGLEGFSGTYNDTTKTLELHSIYGGGMDFHSIMVKQ